MLIENLNSLINQYNELQAQQKEQESQIDSLLSLVNTPPSNKVKLAVFGLLNSGKSTLLNILTNHIDEDFFQTGDHRVTVKNQVLESEDIIYIDTPGIDGSAQDDIVASIGKDKADIILFVHNAAKELEQEEIDLLLELKNTFGQHTKDSVILLMSRADSIDPEDLNKVQNKIHEQCTSLLNEELEILSISSHLYRKSMHETEERRKNGFLKLSNIDVLNQKISERVANIDPMLAYTERMSAKIEQILSLNNTLQQEFKSLANQIEQEFNSSLEDFNQHMDKFNTWLIDSRKRYQDMQSKLSRL